ncbi:uncharacterized protein LOC135494337 [Lineus longissimus]|uniref:uncharacterized protein LOC135494337 n=1 Tax=Lineus longissimus TaxID=88925 RepID=UPI00315C4C6A
MAKARVVPLKPVTVPRLELQAAVVSVKISDLFNRELTYPNFKNVLWTNSKVAIGYIKNEARRFHIYVANRIQRIHESSSPNQWRYVATDENPADFASRGLRADELAVCNWFQRPQFLWQDETPAETIPQEPITSDDPEVRKVNVLANGTAVNTPLLDRLNKFSNWSKLTLAISVLLNCCSRKLKQDQASPLQARRKAEKVLIKTIQKEAFREELTQLQQKETVKRNSRLHDLDPFFI